MGNKEWGSDEQGRDKDSMVKEIKLDTVSVCLSFTEASYKLGQMKWQQGRERRRSGEEKEKKKKEE